jgi:hypothetical protein
MLIAVKELDFYGWNGILLMTFVMAGVTHCNQKEGMVFPGFEPLSG